MPRILYSPSTVSNPDVETPRYIPDDYQRIQSTPASFGGLIGAAEERAGANINAASDELYGTAIKLQTIKNTTDADQAVQNYVDGVNKIFYGDPDTPGDQGLFAKKGGDALSAIKPAQDQMNGLMSQLAGNLNPMARNMFMADARRYSMMHQDEMFRFGQQQQLEHTQQVNVAGQDVAIANAATNYNSYNQVNSSIDMATDRAVKAQEVKSGPLGDDEKAVIHRNMTDKAVEAAVGAALGHGDYGTAGNLLQQFGGNMNGMTFGRLKDSVDTQQYNHEHRDQSTMDKNIGDSIFEGRPIPVAPGGGAPAPGAARGASGADPDLVSYGQQVAQQNGVPWEIFQHQIAGESSWNPNVANSGVGDNGGAKGIAQFEDGTATQYGVDVHDPKSSLSGAARYMADLHQQGGTWVSALTGYLTGKPSDQPVADVVRRNPEYAAAYAAAARLDRGEGPPAETSSPSLVQSTGNTIALGDSIAAGVAGAGGYKQTYEPADKPEARANAGILAASGRTTNETLAVIRANPQQFAGQNIMLSGGISNDLNSGGSLNTALANTQQEITMLKQAGANVALIGVGTGVQNYQAANAQLALLAQKNGVPFTGQLATTEGGRVHPSDYKAVINQLPADWTASVAPANEPGAPVQLAAAGPTATAGVQTATDAAASPSDTVLGQPTPKADQPPALAALPSLESLLAKIPQGLSPDDYAKVDARIRQRYSEHLQSIYEERRRMEPWLQGGMAMLADGKDFQYDPNTIRHYLTPSEADKALDALDTAKSMGQWKTQIQTMNPTQIQSLSDKLHQDLSSANADQYPRARKILDTFDASVRSQTIQMLGGTNEEGQTVKADPAGYLRRVDPGLDAKFQAIDFTNPASVDAYANSMKARQDMMGVPVGLQHVVSRTQAEQISQAISADPANAADVMQRMSQQWGSHWGDVFNDAVTLGKLPAPYQIVQHLEDIKDPHNAALLARGLAGTDKQENQFWEKTIGDKQKKTIDDAILGNSNMQMFVHSMEMSGAPVDQMNSLIGAVHSLAYAKQAYEGDKIQSDAATDAVNAIIANHYSFLTEYGGNARVPSDVASTVRSNIDYTLGALDKTNTTVPPLTNGVTPDQYLAVVRANPTWVTNKDDQGVHLVDKDGRDVLDIRGRRINIPFNAPRWAPPGTQPADYPTGSL